jgi:hypothetical protein
MQHSSSNATSTNIAQKARLKGQKFFVIGWILIAINLLGVLWSILLPLDLLTRRNRLGYLFFFDEAATYALWGSVAVGAFFLFALIQVLFLHRVASRMVEDTPETQAAEAALHLAKVTAYFLLFISIVSLIYDLKVARAWYDMTQLMKGIK